MTSAFEAYQGQTQDVEAAVETVDKPFETVPLNREDFMTKAKLLVLRDFNELFFAANDVVNRARLDEFYVVGFEKELQNWKGRVSTDIIPGQYWEITYDGNKQQAYVDHYVKRSNKVVTDEEYASMP